MAAFYDTYDYPSYWDGREYEHGAEVIALKSFLKRIPKVKRVLEIGAGYGRLTPTYIYRASQVLLADPSAKLLKIARRRFRTKKVRFIQVRAENLKGRVKGKSIDLIFVVRVIHHLDNIDSVFEVVKGLLKKNGYFILEFPNKKHLKATILEFFRGNFTFPIDIFPKDLRSQKSLKKGDVPFVNYHPDVIYQKLIDRGFMILETRSVSNIRSSFLKEIIPLDLLLFIEKGLQQLLARISFGPSIFILAKKVGH